MKLFLGVIAVLAFASASQAETLYVIDQAELPMRAGEGTNYRITRMLNSGMPVEVLEKSKSGYSHVRTQDGKDGWILSRYLMTTPTARERIAAYEKDITRMEQLKQQQDAANKEILRLQAENRKLENDLQHIRKTAGNVAEVAEQNLALKNEVAAARQALTEMEQSTASIRSGAQQRWFLMGGGAIVVGLILGLILPHMGGRKKRRGGF